MTLACEDANSELVEVFTVVDVDDEKRVDKSLVQLISCSDFEDKFQGLVKILKLMFRQDFEVWSLFRC